MKKNINYSTVIILLLVVAVVAMSVGFANFSDVLNITGNTTVSMSSWNVEFDSNSYSATTGSVNVSEENYKVLSTTMSYNVALQKPGDFYEFTINVINSGTFDAELKGVTLTELTEAQKKYLRYELVYGANTYTASNNSVSGVVLPAINNNRAAVRVRVQYIQPDDPEELPKEAVNLQLIASLSFKQVGA